ncbi:MAG: hypothetical protein R6U26_01865 [Candidatus Undinarchaeales archaeon]
MARRQRDADQYQDINSMLNSLSTKTRINEQNIMNLHNKLQVLSRNFLDFKKEIRDKVGSGVGKDFEELEKKIDKKMKQIDKKIEMLEKKKKIKEAVSPTSKKGMTSEEADKILDNILKKTGEN